MTLEERVAQLEHQVAELTAMLSHTRKTKGKLHRIPEDWEPSRELHQWAKDHKHVDVEREILGFKEWHTAKGTEYVDWNAAFRSWIRRCSSIASPRVAAFQGRPASRTATIDEANRERVERTLDLMAKVRGATD